ncbi:hypothetical protein ACOSQ3_007183 [Xanthoceras sorbifolium]
MCPYMENYGLGPQVENPGGVLLNDSWFSTNQFSLEVIFGNKMKQYECLTNDSSIASAIYVPYYAGLDIGRYLWDYNISVRDSSALDIAKWLVEKPEWKRMLGRDHFFVAGRIGWDFRRKRDKNSDWGSKLMSLPEFMNMSMLSIESTFWSNEYAIPYPTYFHPRSQNEIVEWQHKMTSRKRNHLLSFAGAPRPTLTDSIRGEIMKQCLSSGTSCKLLDCSSSSSSSDGKNKCENPVEVIKVFGDSVFCLQPSGDSYTRRSTFDSILAGCIPVFFHPGSAYAQYTWYFPKNYTKYSVYIPEDSIKGGKVNITEILIGVSEEEILAMREEVIRLIPKIVYGDPRWSAGVVDQKLEEDAFYIAVRGILERIENVRRRIKDIGFAQEYHDF